MEHISRADRALLHVEEHHPEVMGEISFRPDEALAASEHLENG